jgi:hypothetical protein
MVIDRKTVNAPSNDKLYNRGQKSDQEWTSITSYFENKSNASQNKLAAC